MSKFVSVHYPFQCSTGSDMAMDTQIDSDRRYSPCVGRRRGRSKSISRISARPGGREESAAFCDREEDVQQDQVDHRRLGQVQILLRSGIGQATGHGRAVRREIFASGRQSTQSSNHPSTHRLTIRINGMTIGITRTKTIHSITIKKTIRISE